ncbi:MAG: hypothetical protein RLZZ234_781 [Candidatus Parcubacteria bacterium]|jgi:predicted nucleotidyltransferase
MNVETTIAAAANNRRKVDIKQLADEAVDLVRSSQRADYDFLEDSLKINPSTAQRVLKRLRTKGDVAQRSDRRWVVIVNADGTKKAPDDIPNLKRFKKKKSKKVVAATKATPQTEPGAVALPTKAKSTEKVTDSEKLELITKLAAISDGRTRVVLHAIKADIDRASEANVILELLKR